MFNKSSHKSLAKICYEYCIYLLNSEKYLQRIRGRTTFKLFHFIVTKGNIVSIKLDFVLQYESVQYPFVLSSIGVEYLVEQFPHQLDIKLFGFTSGHYTALQGLE